MKQGIFLEALQIVSLHVINLEQNYFFGTFELLKCKWAWEQKSDLNNKKYHRLFFISQSTSRIERCKIGVRQDFEKKNSRTGGRKPLFRDHFPH